MRRFLVLGLVLAALLLVGDNHSPALAQSPGLEAIGSCGRHVSGPGTYDFTLLEECDRNYWIAFEPLAQTTFNFTVDFTGIADETYRGGSVTLREGAGRDGYQITMCSIDVYNRTGCNPFGVRTNPDLTAAMAYLQPRTYTLQMNAYIYECLGCVSYVTSGSITIRDLGGVDYAAVPSTSAYTFPTHPTTAGLTAIGADCGEALISLPIHASIIYDRQGVGGRSCVYDFFPSFQNKSYTHRTFAVNVEATYTFTVEALQFGTHPVRTFVGARILEGHGTDGAHVELASSRPDRRIVSASSDGDATATWIGDLPAGNYTLAIWGGGHGGDGTVRIANTGIVLVQPVLVPGLVSLLTATTGDRTATLNWEAPASDGGATITSYEYSLDNITYIDVGDVLTVTLPNLENGVVNVVHVRAVNSAGPGVALSHKFVVGEVTTPVTSFDITLSPGANLISLPLVPDDIGIEAVLTGILDRVETVWQYDTSGAVPRWRSYAPGAPSDLGVMRDGLGYWVLLKDGGAGDTVLTVTGREETGPARRVARGWNLVGFTSTSLQSPGEYLGALGGSAGTTMVGYAGGAAVAVLPSAAPPQLIPGRGYWLYVESAGTIGGAPPETMAALVALYNATGGANWRNNGNWLSNAPIGAWHGVTTDSDGRVTHLDLYSNQLTGEIPAELGSLTNLEVLALFDNQLTGEIPAELGNLANLQTLFLEGNQLTGEIPAELGSLTNLEWLHLSSNQLTGEIPAELGNLANLELLSLYDNQLTGEIPAELGSLTNLEWLHLSSNQLTGEIPAELGNLTNLELLSLYDNQLTGEIPAELGSLTNLEWLHLSSNQLTGCIPEGLRNVANNDFSILGKGGLIDRGLPFCMPSAGDAAALVALYNATGGANWGNNRKWLSNAPMGEWHGVTTDSDGRVTDLSLAYNQLTGEIPAELGNLANLQTLFLEGNQLTGAIPAELGRLPNLEWLHLSSNQLTGCIPEGLRNVANNDFSSLGLPFCMPSAGDAATDRAALVALYNATGGRNWRNNGNWLSNAPIGAWHGVTTGSDGRVTHLHLYRNQLTGEIPAELGSLTSLRRLDLYSNRLTGSIPAELGSLTSLGRLDLYRNWLTGSIPAELGSLTNLEYLDLYHNRLTGEIPAELGDLTKLEGLWLSFNFLTGEIPAELGDLSNLEYLSLYGNQLTGCIPAGLRNVANNDFSILGKGGLIDRGLPFCIPSASAGDAASDRAALVALYNATGGANWGNNRKWLSNAPMGEWDGVITDSDGRVTVLSLAYNQLTGSIPAELRNIPRNDFGQLGLAFCGS